MPSTTSSTHPPAALVPAPSNPVLLATQSQWIFTDSELYRTPSILDGMTIEAEHTSRSKGVNFITQVGILLKLPQLTIATASVYLHRFFMRYSMKDLPQRPGMHPYSVAATALFLATKVDENCRKMRELIVAYCRVAQKKPNLIVDEQSKDYWRWRDTILHNEDLLLEALCFDLQLEQPYRLLYEFMCFFKVQHDKRLRNCAWAFLNDSTFTVLCVQFSTRTIAASSLYAAVRHCDVSFEDDSLGRPWWEQLGVDLTEMRRACDRMADIYEIVSAPVPSQKYLHLPNQEDDMNKTRIFHRRKSDSSADNKAESQSPGEINGRKRDREDNQDSSNQGTGSLPQNGASRTDEDTERSPKRQRRNSQADTDPNSSFSRSQSSQPSFVQAASGLNLSSNQFSQNDNSHGPPNGSHNISPNQNRPSRVPRVPANFYRPEHPLPPPPPVQVPPLSPSQMSRESSNGSYNSRVPNGARRPLPGASQFHPPRGPPPPQPSAASAEPSADSVQQRIDAIIQQGLPSENVHDNYSRPPQSSDRYRSRDRDRERNRDRGGHRDREHDQDRHRDHERPRRPSTSLSASSSMPPGPLPQSASPGAGPRQATPEARKEPSLKKDGVNGEVSSPNGEKKVDEQQADDDNGGGSEEGEL